MVLIVRNYLGLLLAIVEAIVAAWFLGIYQILDHALQLNLFIRLRCTYVHSSSTHERKYTFFFTIFCILGRQNMNISDYKFSIKALVSALTNLCVMCHYKIFVLAAAVIFISIIIFTFGLQEDG